MLFNSMLYNLGNFSFSCCHEKVVTEKKSVALASLSDFVKASRDTSFYINEFQGRA